MLHALIRLILAGLILAVVFKGIGLGVVVRTAVSLLARTFELIGFLLRSVVTHRL